MTDLAEILSNVDRDIKFAENQRRVLQRVQAFCDDISGFGFDPQLHCTSNSVATGLVMMTIDLSCRLDRATEEPALSPCPERPAPAPALKSGKFTDDEKVEIVHRTVAGEAANDIAEALCRTVGSINVMRRHLKADIEAATGSSEPEPAPEPEPTPEPAPTSHRLTDHPGLSAAERAIMAHLNAVGHVLPWSPDADLQLAEALVRGDGAGQVAGDLGLPKDTAIERWKLINTDRSSLDHQSRLLTVLRLRAQI